MTHASQPATSNNRDVMSNGRLLPRGIDMRSSGGRRFRYLVGAFTSEMGGEPTELELGLIKQAATLQVAIEGMQARIVGGDQGVDPDQIIRLSSEHRRLLSQLGKKVETNKPAGPTSLHELLAGADDA